MAPIATLRRADMTAGSAQENTLLALSLLHERPLFTAIRPLRSSTIDSAFVRLGSAVSSNPRGRVSATWTPTWSAMWINTGAATHDRDGAVWQGRGATLAASTGLQVRQGWFELALRPLSFVTQNLSYDPLAIVDEPLGDFGQPTMRRFIDLPYRFGDAAYWRLDPGESWLRSDVGPVGIGVSTGSQQWGPSHFFPLLLSVESAGFPRVFVEARELATPIATVDAQWSMGRLESSGFDALAPGGRSRAAPALVLAMRPAHLRGLELGAARFFHVRWDSSAVSTSVAMLPFAGLLKAGNPTGETVARDVNQLASLFVRLHPPGSGFEIYGEFFREDHNVDVRDLLVEPDHASAYTVGLRRAWRVPDGIRSLTIETVNGRLSHLERVRDQAPIYTHGPVAEGHTFRGQPLGSLAAFQGSGRVVSFQTASQERSTLIETRIVSAGHDEEGGSLRGNHGARYSLLVGRGRPWRGRILTNMATIAIGQARLDRPRWRMTLASTLQ